jgi:predicted metal-dependent phosphoesterase TrpH
VIDLHTHSRFSDGSDSPAQLAERAAALGLSAIALTDHDTTASHDEMVTACEHHGVELVAGVEVSLRDLAFTRPLPNGGDEPVNVHVLGYFVPTSPSSSLQRELAELRSDRSRRNIELVALLNELGFERVTIDYVTTLAGSMDSVGRPHFARAMTELHPEIVGEPSGETTAAIFAEWLGQGGRAYLPKTDKSIEQFVRAGAADQVVFSIAHPLVNYASGLSLDEIARKMPPILSSLRDRGIRGVEAYYGGTTDETRRLMVKITRDLAMIPTGGSDYHGSYKPDVALGTGRYGDLRVPDEVLAELKAARG